MALSSHTLRETPIRLDKDFQIDWDKELNLDEDLHERCQEDSVKETEATKRNSWTILSGRHCEEGWSEGMIRSFTPHDQRGRYVF